MCCCTLWSNTMLCKKHNNSHHPCHCRERKEKDAVCTLLRLMYATVTLATGGVLHKL